MGREGRAPFALILHTHRRFPEQASLLLVWWTTKSSWGRPATCLPLGIPKTPPPQPLLFCRLFRCFKGQRGVNNR